MIPESAEGFHEYLEERYAMPEDHHEDHNTTHHDEGHARRLGGGGGEGDGNPYATVINYPWATLTIGLVTALLVAIDRTIVSHGMHGDGEDGHHDHHGHDHVSKAFITMQEATEGKKGEKEAPGAPGPSYGTVARSVAGEQQKREKSEAATVIAVGECGNGAEGAAPLLEPAARREAALRALVFFVAMSIHSIMDGLSLGAEQDINNFYAILVAVLAHKAFDGIALGIPVYLAQLSPLATWGSLLTCAFMTPLGIGIGWGAVEGATGNQATLASAVIVSISGGSFLYISMMELLPASLHDGRLLALKFLAFVAGFGGMAVLAAYL